MQADCKNVFLPLPWNVSGHFQHRNHSWRADKRSRVKDPLHGCQQSKLYESRVSNISYGYCLCLVSFAVKKWWVLSQPSGVTTWETRIWFTPLQARVRCWEHWGPDCRAWKTPFFSLHLWLVLMGTYRYKYSPWDDHWHFRGGWKFWGWIAYAARGELKTVREKI